LLAEKLGKNFAFIFNDSQQAEGLVDVTVVECRDVPLGELLKSHTSRGSAKLTMSVSNLRLDGPIPNAIAQIAQLGNQGIVGNIKDSTITYAKGQTFSDISIYLTRKGVQVPLKLTGGIDLTSNSLLNMITTIPSELFGSDEFLKAAPNGIPLGWRGTTLKYTPDLAGTGKKIAEIQAKAALGNLLGGNKKDDSKSPRGGATTQKSNDPLGGLLDQLQNKDKKKKK
jgi:hypothetical protein